MADLQSIICDPCNPRECGDKKRDCLKTRVPLCRKDGSYIRPPGALPRGSSLDREDLEREKRPRAVVVSQEQRTSVMGYAMIDWFSGQVDLDATHLQLDHLYLVTRDNVCVYDVEKWREVEGSFSSTVNIRRVPSSSDLQPSPVTVYQISGNPTKYLQGHNVFGPSVTQAIPLITDMLHRFPIDVRPDFDTREDEGSLKIRPSRLDITVMIEMGSHERVHQWLRQAEVATRSRHGRALRSGDTVYWGQHSRRWTIKAYCKTCELIEHPIPAIPDRRMQEMLSNYASTQLRLELTLRSEELKENLSSLGDGTFWKYYERLENATMVIDGDDRVEKLPTSTKRVYRDWSHGYDVRQDFKLAMFYRHRRRILETVGRDIALPPVATDLPRLLLDESWLKEHQVGRPPYALEEWLWRPQERIDLRVGAS